MEDQTISKDVKIAAGQFVKEKEYWMNKLSGDIEKCYFPYDHYKEPGAGEYRKDFLKFKISGEPYARLIEITGGSHPKIHVVFTAAAVTLATRYTGNEDMIVGTSIEKQNTEESFVNTVLPLRVSLPAGMTFKELILKTRETINEAIENRNYPVETLAPVQERLLDVVVLLENIQDKKYVEHLRTGITFSFRASAGEIEGELEYDTGKYEKESINRIIYHFMRLLGIALFDVDVKLSEIDLLSEEERKELRRYNSTRTGYPHQKTIHECFREQAGKTPDNIAALDGNHELPQQITYRELDEKSNRLAQRLKQESVESGCIVAIMIEPSIEMITAIMGILKAGAAYLPIDPEYPQERIDYMLRDSGARIVLTADELTAEPGVGAGLAPARDMRPGPGDGQPQGLPLRSSTDGSSSCLAYIIYTSGSTGKPKGVAVEHRALVNYAWWAAKTYVKDEKVNFPLYTSIGFDLTITSLFTPLITGNTIYIYRGESKEFLLDKVFADNKVEAVKLTPVHLMVAGENAREKNLSKIKRFIVGGEKLETRWARQVHDNFKGNIEIYNEYGPTEAAVGCMIYKYDPRKDKGASVPIGVPADNVQIYLLDKNMNDVPVGAIGELYIGGDGLARGYLNRVELTHEKFFGGPGGDFSKKPPSRRRQKIYKTGDLARRLPDNNVEFIGRMDQQVKVRGYRIETGEIENCLSKHESIARAAVVVRSDEDRYNYLVAYIVLSGEGEEKAIETEELREYLSKHLPEFMIPSFFVRLEEIPVTANGKIDKKSLPGPDKSALETGAEYQPPTTELEKITAEIWQEVMGVERVGITDSYFSLGGDSIKAIQVAARLHSASWKLELKDLFQYTTIKELVHHITPLKEISFQGIVEGEVKLTPIQEWFFERHFTDEHHFNQSVLLSRIKGFDEEITKKAFTKLVEHHDALRMVFKREGGKIRQINRGLTGGLFDIRVFDMRDQNDHKKAIAETCSRIQAGIDLSGGPLVKLGIFKWKDMDYLLVVIHHLVMDSVSMRILSEDFTSLYIQMETGVPEDILAIPLKTTPYLEWAEKLYEYSNSEQLVEELKYWRARARSRSGTPSDHGKIKNSGRVSFELAEDYTEKLLKKANSAYNTEINDLLLTALAMAVKDWTGAREVPLMLEGHGREEIIPGIDITRTVGWFTSLYPVVLKMKEEPDVSTLIKEIKEMLRNIPNKGTGYGILRYLTNEDNKQGVEFGLDPGISFNYLGQFDEDINNESFGAADISPGHSVSPDMERICPIYILGSVYKKKLRLSVDYDPSNYRENEIRSFFAGYDKRLRQIIDHCVSRKETELTLSDYSTPVVEQEADQVFDILSNIKLDG